MQSQHQSQHYCVLHQCVVFSSFYPLQLLTPSTPWLVLWAVPFPAYNDKMAGGEDLTASYATTHLLSCTVELR